MRKLLTVALSSLLLSACADTTEKYRDIKHLEMPPTLAIEHNTSAPVKPTRSSTSSSSDSLKSDTSSQKSSSDLDKLIILSGDDNQPVLQLKTRFDRAWDLIDRALMLAEIEVVDKNREAGTIKVRYVADQNSKQRGFFGSVSSFFSDKFADIEYNLSLDKDSRITGVHFTKVTANEKNQDGSEAFNGNDAKPLAELIEKTIKTDLSK